MTEDRLSLIEYRWVGGYDDCEDLREVFAEVRRLRLQIADYQMEHHIVQQGWQDAADERDRLRALAAMSRADANHYEQEAVNLRQALRDYGDHDASCPRRTICFQGSLSAGVLYDRGGSENCTCGLDQAIRGGE